MKRYGAQPPNAVFFTLLLIFGNYEFWRAYGRAVNPHLNVTVFKDVPWKGDEGSIELPAILPLPFVGKAFVWTSQVVPRNPSRFVKMAEDRAIRIDHRPHPMRLRRTKPWVIHAVCSPWGLASLICNVNSFSACREAKCLANTMSWA